MFKKLQIYAAWGAFSLYILGDFDEEVEEKKLWIKTHTNFSYENVIFVLAPEYKDQFANNNAFLIDSRKKSLESFAEAGGNTIEFTEDWEKTVDCLLDMMTGGKQL